MARSGSRPLPDIAPAYAQAVNFYRQGRLDDAERIAARILKSLPDSYDALHLLALVKLGRGRAAAALALLEAALKVNPGSPEAPSNRGLAMAATHLDVG